MRPTIPAHLTETFHEFISNNKDFLAENMPFVFGDSNDYSASFHRVLVGMWGLWEIGFATEDMFKVAMIDTYNHHIEYYKELAKQYYKEFDFTDGLTRVTETEAEDDSNGGDNAKDIHVELPNKKIDAQDIYAYPDSGNKSDGTNWNHAENSATVTTTYNDRYIDMKNKYINQLRNLFAEFGRRFNDCFMQVYGGF